MKSELIAILAEISSVNAEVSAMEAENKTREDRGHSHAYDETEFWARSERLSELANAARSVGD